MIKLITKYITIFLLTLTFSASASADQLEDLKELIEVKVETIISILKNDTISRVEQDKHIYENAEGLFDYTLMSRLSVGKKNWAKLDSTQKQEFIRLFSTLMKESYGEKTHMLSDEIVTVNDAQQIKKSRIYVSVSIKGSKEATELIYKFYYSKKGLWLVYDVDIAGVSILQTYRAQFAETLKSDDMVVLMEKLKSSISTH